MKSPMLPKDHQAAVRRIFAIWLATPASVIMSVLLPSQWRTRLNSD
jgi:hypothetical protein